MKETDHVVNPEASPSPPREVGEAEPVLTLTPTRRGVAVA